VWLCVGLLLGFPMALGVSASFVIGVHFQEGCRGTALTLVVGGVGFAILVIGAAGAGWLASPGVRGAVDAWQGSLSAYSSRWP
jgi:hypothetical protein